jgi:hypothetical protein
MNTRLMKGIGTLGIVLLVLLILLLIGGLPTWGFHSYGWGPPGIIGVILIVVIVLLVAGRL